MNPSVRVQKPENNPKSLVKELNNAKLIENLIGKKELAQKLSLSVSMIDKLLAQGLPHYKIGRAVRFNCSNVMDFLERRKFP